MPPEESERALEEGCCAGLRLVWQDFGVGEPGSVVDGDMKGFPSKTFTASSAVALAAPVAGDAMTDAVDAAEFL